MLLDFSPYKFWKKKIDPAAMSDADLAKRLDRAKFIHDNLREYSMQVATASFFTFPIVGWGTILFTGTMAVSGGALLGAFGAAYAVYKLGGHLLSKGVVRAVNEKGAIEAEQQVREVRRVAKERQMAVEEAERQIKAIRDREIQLKEAFNAAINAGLPLEQAIQVRKSPLSLKTTTRRSFLGLGF